jgi:hypothetical protein
MILNPQKLPYGGALFSSQEVEEVHQELGMLVVGLHHAARGLHQLFQDSSEHVTQLQASLAFFLLQATLATFVGNFWY